MPAPQAVDVDSPADHRVRRIELPALDRQIDCHEDETVFAAARRAGVRIVGACGGRGVCGTCKVSVLAGQVHRHDETSHGKWLRACRLSPATDLRLGISPRSLAQVVRADVRAGDPGQALACDPAVRALDVRLAPASLLDLRSDTTRVCDAVAALDAALSPLAVDAAAAAELPALLRVGDWRVDARIALAPTGPSLIGAARPGAPLLGLAVDLGTTNAAAFLVDLRNGHRLASLGVENPQVAWGADLISRIHHAGRSAEAAESLRRAAIDAINSLAHDLALAVAATPLDIVDVVVCGNTAMQHLLAGWPVAQLGRAPFVAAMCEPLDASARGLGLAVARGARIHLAPSIGGFVGGDHVATLLATEPLWSQAGSTLVMDIGTNSEIALVQGGRIWSASCPSGPALEGGHIGSGMRAARGAIEHVEIDAEGALKLEVIGGGRPVGLCGSGVLDALAAFVHAGWVDARGRIVADGPRAAVADGTRSITLAAEAHGLPAVNFSQGDVRAVQLAKSAIRTGVELLLAQAGSAASSIDRFVIAGAFGAHLSIDSALAIGLLPPLARERFVQVGNAAGLGVQQMLASRERRVRAARLATECRYVELSSRGDFQKAFLHHLGLAPNPP